VRNGPNFSSKKAIVSEPPVAPSAPAAPSTPRPAKAQTPKPGKIPRKSEVKPSPAKKEKEEKASTKKKKKKKDSSDDEESGKGKKQKLTDTRNTSLLEEAEEYRWSHDVSYLSVITSLLDCSFPYQ
jgi:hypothetical protein